MIRYRDEHGGIVELEIEGGLYVVDITALGPMSKARAMGHAWKTYTDGEDNNDG